MFNNLPYLALELHRKKSLLYPSNGILELEQFRLCEDKDAVITYYMKSVCLDGHTIVSIRTSNVNQSSG
jgi:hypothetical protein